MSADAVPSPGRLIDRIPTLDGAEMLKGAGQFNFLEDISVEDWNAVEEASRKSGK